LKKGAHELALISISIDGVTVQRAEELLALAADRKGWAERVKQIDPVDHNTAAKMVTSPLDANAMEWMKGTEIHDGLFTG
jgi:hypothetical protein